MLVVITPATRGHMGVNILLFIYDLYGCFFLMWTCSNSGHHHKPVSIIAQISLRRGSHLLWFWSLSSRKNGGSQEVVFFFFCMILYDVHTGPS